MLLSIGKTDIKRILFQNQEKYPTKDASSVGQVLSQRYAVLIVPKENSDAVAGMSAASQIIGIRAAE